MTKAALSEDGGVGGGVCVCVCVCVVVGGGLYQEHVSASTNQGAKVRRLREVGITLNQLKGRM